MKTRIFIDPSYRCCGIAILREGEGTAQILLDAIKLRHGKISNDYKEALQCAIQYRDAWVHWLKNGLVNLIGEYESNDIELFLEVPVPRPFGPATMSTTQLWGLSFLLQDLFFSGIGHSNGINTIPPTYFSNQMKSLHPSFSKKDNDFRDRTIEEDLTKCFASKRKAIDWVNKNLLLQPDVATAAYFMLFIYQGIKLVQIPNVKLVEDCIYG